MKRDPFYQQIISSLSKPLDPDLFEHCAADILRPEWPTLVPIRGGNDAGMDGAVGDGNGSAFPLICTTGKNVIDNLTRSLTSYIRNGGTRNVAILATSQKLSRPRRQNLEERAHEKGFTLLQIYDQAAIANRLYRDPVWCLELLNLTGNPPALSVIPLTTRPFLDIPLIGRMEELEWLSTQSGDRLIIGQPGCGKTFLLHEFAKQDGGLFVISRDRGEIAAELRAEQPLTLIVDDAHVDLVLLTELQHLRRDLGLSFDLIACSWPGEQDEIAQALSLTEPQIRELALLTRDQILAVIKSTGIAGPDDLLREIVDQAEGRPGLAVTLAHLCRHGGVREVALGDALNRSITTTFEPLVGKHATELLAGFAVGGNSGMEWETVARLSELPLLQVRRDMASLAAGGVVRPLPENRVAVRPGGLRHTLVRDLFFQKVLPLPIQPFIDKAPDKAEVARTLIGARSRGGNVPDDLLVPLLAELGPSAPWIEYAALGKAETVFVLQNSIAGIDTVAEAALYYLPDEAVTGLLGAAYGTTAPAGPLGHIRKWVISAEPGDGNAVPRRRAVVRAVAQWLRSIPSSTEDPPDRRDKSSQTALPALAAALSPRFERTTMDPGAGNTLTIARGVLSLPEIKEMHGVWAEAFPLLRPLLPHQWQEILKVVSDWCYAERHAYQETTGEVKEAMHEIARHMVADLAPLVSERPGLTAALHQLASPLGIDIALPRDPDFAVLFPKQYYGSDWQEAELLQKEAREALADEWAHYLPQESATRLRTYEMEADLAGPELRRTTVPFCYELSARVALPGQWAYAFAEVELAANLILPFLERAVVSREEGWEALLSRLIDNPLQSVAATRCVLMLDAPSADLLDKTLALVSSCGLLVNTVCLRNEVPVSTVRRLLQHEEVSVATAAATGIWAADPQGTIPAELQVEWRAAVVRTPNDDSWLGEILKADKSLAMDWLKARLADEQGYFFRLSDNMRSAISTLDEPERMSLLPIIPERFGVGELIGWLVGDSAAVFDALLRTPGLRSSHLEPLGKATDLRVLRMSLQALEAGYNPTEVGSALMIFPWSFTGSEAAMWQQHVDRFETLMQKSKEEIKDSRLTEAIRVAWNIARQRRDQAKKQEHAEAVYGR